MRSKIARLVTLIATIGLGTTPFAMAQGGAAPAPAQQQQPAQQKPAPDDSKLDSFVVAFLEVDRIGKEYAPKLKEAKSPDQQAKIRQQAGTEMMQAVESQQGITVDEYNAIIEQAQSDPDLATRINTKLQGSAK